MINEQILREGGLKHYPFFDTIAAIPAVKAIYLYGSRAKGDFDDWSDIDLLIDCPDMSGWGDVREVAATTTLLVDIECTRLQDVKDEVFKAQLEKYRKPLYAKH